MDFNDDLVIGWTAIGKACGKNPVTLRQRHAAGLLAVQPIRQGYRVAMTPAMIQELVAQPKTKAPAA